MLQGQLSHEAGLRILFELLTVAGQQETQYIKTISSFLHRIYYSRASSVDIPVDRINGVPFAAIYLKKRIIINFA
jgi:hypothetical protein